MRPPGREGGSRGCVSGELDIGASHLPALRPHWTWRPQGSQGRSLSAGFPHRAERAAGFGMQAGLEDRPGEGVPLQMKCSRSLWVAGTASDPATRKPPFTSCYTVSDWLYFQIHNFPKGMESPKDKDT